MSEIMSHVEIEDVLSSIRRLVSQDLRPTRTAPDPGQAGGATAKQVMGVTSAPSSSDTRLILTPALRVVSDRSLHVPAEPPVAKPPLPRLHLGLESRLDPDAKAFDMSGTPLDSEFESDTGDPYPDVTRMESTEDGWVLARTEPAPEGPIDPWAAEEYSGLVQEDAFSEPEQAADLGDDLSSAAASPRAADQPAIDQSGAAPQAQKQDEDLEVVFDEQVLRDLVRDVLREELQGRMGERMTRNIRKLVHAEIARLIAAQDLD